MKQFFIIYIIEVTVIISVFYLIYKNIYNKYFYYEWNRFFLVLSIIISLIIPLIEIKYFQTSSKFTFNPDNILQINLQNNEIFISTEESNSFVRRIYNFINSSKYLTFLNILLIIYISGVIRYFIVFIRNLLSIKRLKKNTFSDFKFEKEEKYQLYTTNSKITAFSYLKSIFVNKNFDKLSEKEKKQIIEHEKIHLEQRHTLDILFFEILNIIFWFNPLMRQYKKKVIENHEFIVDSLMVKKDKSYNYTKLMLKLTMFKQDKIKQNIMLQHGVSKQLKNRVKQITEPERDRIKKIRFLSTIPVILLLIVFFIFLNNVINSSLVDKKNYITEIQTPCENMVIITPYFEEKIISDPNDNNIKYKLSHKKITIKTKNNIKIFATGDGIISQIDTINNWGLDEITIKIKMENNYTAIYEKLSRIEVKLNQKIKKGQIISITDDIRLYPAFNYQLLHNNKPINPKF